jgi:hypothetical protein
MYSCIAGNISWLAESLEIVFCDEHMPETEYDRSNWLIVSLIK